MKKLKTKIKSMAAIIACFAVCMLFFACGDSDGNGGNNNGGGNTGGGNTGEKIEKASVKYYDSEQNVNTVITFDNNGKRFRVDLFNIDSECFKFDSDGNVEVRPASSYIIDHINKTFCTYTVKNGWNESSYDKLMEDPGSYMLYPENIVNEDTLKYTFPVDPILENSCKGYTYFQNGKSVQINFWNGVILSKKVDGKERMEAMRLILDVPAKAFTKTADLSWIKSNDFTKGRGIGTFTCKNSYSLNYCSYTFKNTSKEGGFYFSSTDVSCNASPLFNVKEGIPLGSFCLTCDDEQMFDNFAWVDRMDNIGMVYEGYIPEGYEPATGKLIIAEGYTIKISISKLDCWFNGDFEILPATLIYYGSIKYSAIN
jgi:hypothetical protein